LRQKNFEKWLAFVTVMASGQSVLSKLGIASGLCYTAPSQNVVNCYDYYL